MLKPRFLLTKKIVMDIYRTTQGRYVAGEYVDGVTTTIQRNVNIQPLKADELLLLPESERSREWYKLYSDEDLRTAREGVSGWAADEFMWQGDRYKVMKAQNHAMGILNHWKVLAARLDLTQEAN
jgi:hypothetical protein